MAEIIAGSALIGVGGAVNWVNNLWSYNRENWSFDKDQQQNSMHQQQNLRIQRYTQFREDMRDLFDLTSNKVGSYLTATTLQLGFVISLFYDGRLSSDGSAPNSSPEWLVTLYGLSLGSAGAYLLLSIYFSINATIQAQSFSVRILTQHLRLPIPTDQDVWNCASRYKEFEECDTQMRIPYFTAAGKKVYHALKRKVEHAAGSPLTKEHEQEPLKQQVHVSRTYGAALGPPQLVAEDRFGKVLPVSRLPHIRMFRNMQEHWQPFDAYSRVSMVLGTISLCVAVCHFNTLWYLRTLHQINFSITLTTAFSSVSVCVLFLEVSFDSSIEKFISCGFLIGSPCIAYICAIADTVVLWEKINNETLSWNIDSGIAFQRFATPVAFLCHLGFICVYAMNAQPLSLPGFIRNLPHRFRNVRVIDVFAPMHSATTRRLLQLLKMENPHEKGMKSQPGDAQDLSSDPVPKSVCNLSPEYMATLMQAIELREHIGVTLADAFHDAAARNHKPLVDLATRFQQKCMTLANYIPADYPATPFVVPSNKPMHSQELHLVVTELSSMVDVLSCTIVDLREYSAGIRRQDSRRLAERAKKKKASPHSLPRRSNTMPFSNGGLWYKINKHLGVDARYDNSDDADEYDDDSDNEDGADDTKMLPKMVRSPWDPPYAHNVFFVCMLVSGILHTTAFVWIVYRSITDERLGASNNLLIDGQIQDVDANGILPPGSRRLVEFPSYTMTDKLVVRTNPLSGARLFGCDADDAYFGTYLDYMRMPLLTQIQSSPQLGPPCVDNDVKYDAFAIRTALFMISEHEIVECGMQTALPIRRLPKESRVTAFDFYREFILAALDIGGVVLLEKKNLGWTSLRVLWDKSNVTSISIRSDGAVQLVSDGDLYDAALAQQPPYQLEGLPRMRDGFRRRMWQVQAIAMCPNGRSIIQTQNQWWYEI